MLTAAYLESLKQVLHVYLEWRMLAYADVC
jgi:hypothetical protein